MDKDFGAKQLKPGDPGFVYDKVVEFKQAEGPLEDDSWGESDGVQENQEEEYYYDEEEEEVPVEEMQHAAQIQRASNLESEADYFDDDFDDDFA